MMRNCPLFALTHICAPAPCAPASPQNYCCGMCEGNWTTTSSGGWEDDDCECAEPYALAADNVTCS